MLHAVGCGNNQRADTLRGTLRTCLPQEFGGWGNSRSEESARARGKTACQSGKKEFPTSPFFHCSPKNATFWLGSVAYGLNPTLRHSSAQLYIVPLVMTNST